MKQKNNKSIATWPVDLATKIKKNPGFYGSYTANFEKYLKNNNVKIN